MKTKVNRKLTMKRRKSGTHMNPHNILVGFSGRVRRDSRLEPLRMNRKYKSVLQQEESDRNEKVLQMSTLVHKYKNLLSLINSLRKQNRCNSNASLIVELEELMKRCRKHLLFLESKIDCLPDGINKSMKGIFNRTDLKSELYTCTANSLKRKKDAHQETACPNKENISFERDKIKRSTSNSSCNKTVDKNFDVNNRFSWYGSVKSQILVRTSCSQLRTISIDLFSNGENLFQVLASEFGGNVNSYNVTFGTKQINRKKTLWEQEIYHGTTVDLNMGLHGGMGKKKGGKKKKTKVENNPPKADSSVGSVPENPEFWTKSQVVQWITNICKECEIDEEEVSNLMSVNGKGLNKLRDKDDWKGRSPAHGDLLYNEWNKLKEEYSKKEMHSQTAEKETVHEDEERPALVEPNEEKPSGSAAEDLHDVCVKPVPVELEEKENDSATRGPFGKVENLTDLEDSISLYDFATDSKLPRPQFGSVVSVTGICSKFDEALGTMFLRDDPPGAVSVFNQIKVDIRARSENEDLHPNAVETLLKNIASGVSVGVRGRVEPLDDGHVSDHTAHETVGFKLVVDSDCHAVVYAVENNPRRFARQHSQPWYVQQGVYSSVVDGKNLNVGDTITKTANRVFCKSTISDDEIKQFAVAFKNSFDGDIFIGVEGSGKVTGVEFAKEKLSNWRENISKTIGRILPECNEGVVFCSSVEEARANVGKKCFVSVMRLGNTKARDVEKIRTIARIHVTKGEARVYFSKQTDVHASIRIGAETVRFTDYADLFSRLDSLSSRKVAKILDQESYIEQQCKEALKEMEGQKYKILKKIEKFESQKCEFKMIFGDNVVDIIKNNYLAHYSNGFLNSSGGSIFFGVQEEKRSKLGHVVGIVLSQEEKKELVRKSVVILSAFYPPVNTDQFRIKFHEVSISFELVLRYQNSETHSRRAGKIVLLRGPPDEVGTKWPTFLHDKLPGTLCRVIRVKPQRFCIVMESVESNSEQLIETVEKFASKNSKISVDDMGEDELKPILKNVCIVELQVDRSPYPIHLRKPIKTFVFDEHGEIKELSREKLMYRFGLDSRSEFEVDKFLNHVEHFDPSGNSYVLVASPFELPETERDLYGLVIPKWTLTIDFDQRLKKEGHLYKIFEDFNDLHQPERNRFIRTPQHRKLDLNPEHGICWLAARGFEEIATSVSENNHGKWNMTHRGPLKSLLDVELHNSVKPNRLNIIVLWDEQYQALVDSLRIILEDMLCINGQRTAVTFVCSTREAKEEICSKLVKPLQENYWRIIEEDRVYVAPPYVLAQFLSSKLPDPYRPEDDYQVPHKRYHRGNSQILPETLPQHLRQNIHGHLKMMYMTKERKADETILNKERLQFYAGSEITSLGLRTSIGIKRTKMAALEKEFKTLSNDRKSHVSLIIVKSDRGAGTTTMCLQFLFQHHKEYPCAQLVEIKDGLVSHIDDINKLTSLPLLLLVDEEIANLQDFLDFKKELERRNVGVVLLLIESAEDFCKKRPMSPRHSSKAPLKSARDASLYGTSPYRVVELRRELDGREMDELTSKLSGIIDESKRAKLTKLKARAKDQVPLRTFAHFSLTAFGNKFSGLEDYVKFRLGLADEKQKAILAFLSLTHVYTDYTLTASALAGFLEKNNVCLDVEFGNSYLRELLSPPADDNDCRRISFNEVAKEILDQLAAKTLGSSREEKYWQFIKQVSVQMAREVLSANISTKKIDRLARKLFVTSEYETEKFSSLVRAMKDDNFRDIAQDTLMDLVDVFEKHTSFRAHLLAHLAKYQMTVYKNYEEAKPRIEEAVRDQKDDSLLHHIHGDIIRLQVKNLKNQKNVDMNAIVSHAIEGSTCFDFVRHKRPHMSHGYISDAMIRIAVMRAAIKVSGGKKTTSFVDYLIRMIEEIIKERDGEISRNERYLLSLIPDAHQYLDEGVIDFEHKERWKKHFLECIREVPKLKVLYEKLRDESGSFTGRSTWINEISLETQVLYNALEIETKNLTPEQLEERIKEIEQCGSRSKFGERAMKFWILHSRHRKSVPSLEDVNELVKEWVAKAKKKGGNSPHADFYNYVVNVLIALKDPKDREKMMKAAKLMKRQQIKKYNKKEEVVLPLEWLHCKRGHHINSIDSLLNHDDLIKETCRSSNRKPGREVIEGSLFDKRITKWEGIVKDIRSDWHGTIVFKEHLEVRFVPQNVQPCMPKTGESVKFCLSFDRFGLNAWAVVGVAVNKQPKSLSDMVCSDEDSSSEKSDDETTVMSSLFLSDIPEEEKSWDDYNGERMQGVVSTTNSENGYGFLKHPDVLGKLFFHASQLAKPVKSLEGTISKNMVLEFKVEMLTERTRAADIHVVESNDVSPTLKEYLKASEHSEQHPSPSNTRREKASASHGKDIHFPRNNPVNKGSVPPICDRVQFRVSEKKKRLQENDIHVQSQCRWASLIGHGIQEGIVVCASDDGGFITSQKVNGDLPFYNKDIVNKRLPVDDTTVHFEVQKRDGACIAVKICVIDAPETTVFQP